MCVQARSGFFLASRRAPVAASAASSAQREASGGRGSHAAFATSPVGVSRNGPRDTRYRRGRQPRHALRDPTPSATGAWWRRSTRARGKTRPLSKEMGKILEQKRWPTRKLAAYLLERLRVVWWSRRAPRRSRSRMLRSKLVRPLGSRRAKTDRRDAHRPTLGASLASRKRCAGCASHWYTRARSSSTRSSDGCAVRRSGFGAEGLSKRLKETVAHVPSYVERQLKMIDVLTEQIADKEMKKLVLRLRWNTPNPTFWLQPGLSCTKVGQAFRGH